MTSSQVEAIERAGRSSMIWAPEETPAEQSAIVRALLPAAFVIASIAVLLIVLL